MLRKLACVAVVLGFSVGLIMAEEFGVNIKKVDGNTITAVKGAKKGEKGTEVTLTTIADVKVLKGNFNADTKKLEPGDPIEGGLKNKMFTEIGDKGLNVRVTTNDDGKVTQIVVGGKKKKAAN